MGAPSEPSTNGNIAQLRAGGAEVETGQTRLDPAYPDLPVTVAEQHGDRFRVDYHGGGWAILPAETIRQLYPTVADGEQAA